MSSSFVQSRRPKRWLASVGILLVAAVGFILLRRGSSPEITISKKTTFVEGPIGVDGHVDYVGAINAKYSQGATPENNAVVPLARALGPGKFAEPIRETLFRELGIRVLPYKGPYFQSSRVFAERIASKEPHKYLDYLKDFDKELDKGIKVPWSRDELPKLAAWLAANENPPALVRKATLRQVWYRPIVLPPDDEGATLLAARLPVTVECRDFAKALSARALLAVREGRIDDAHGDLLACHRLARLVAKGHSLIDFLVGNSVETIACRAEIAAVHSGRATAKQLDDYQQTLIELGPLESLAEKINFGERIIVLDSVAKMARGELKGEDSESGGNSLENAAANLGSGFLSTLLNWNVVLETINDRFDRLHKVLRKPTFVQREAAMHDLQRYLDACKSEAMEFSGKVLLSTNERSRRFAHLLCALLEPALFKVALSHDRAVSRFQLTLLAVALERYRKAHGKFPDKLTALQPRFVKKLPRDLFTEKPFVYKPTKTGYLLYSLDPNRKDNGGKDRGTENVDDITVRMRLTDK